MVIRLLGPVVVLRVVGTDKPRKFLIVAYDDSCNVELLVDEPWMTDEAIGERLAEREGLDRLINAVANYIRKGGHLQGGEVGST